MIETVLVNATTTGMGGGIQVGVSFLEYAAGHEDSSIRFVFAVSRPIHDSLPEPLRSDPRVHVFDRSPARPFGGREVRRRLKELERRHRPKIVYSLGFPSYVRFDAPEIGRYTNPWEFLATPIAWSCIPAAERVPLWLKVRYRLHWARRAWLFETQTEAAKRGIMRTLGVGAERVTVVPNAPNLRFLEASGATDASIADGPRVLCLAAPYRHKNLGMVPIVARRVRDADPHRAWRFGLTLPADSTIYRDIARGAERLGVTDMIENLGPIRLDECIREYRRATVVFMPTLLEVFSATYVEAMAMARPIVTSNLDFARDICGDAALYYDPLSPAAAAAALRSVVDDPSLSAMVVERGRRRLATFPTPEEKHRQVIDWLRSLIVQRAPTSSRAPASAVDPKSATR